MEILKASNISKVYQESNMLRVLNGVNLTVHKGEFVAVLGRSGSGKSTLLNILAGLDTPSDGDVYVDHVNIFQLPDKKRTMVRREKIGFIFQAYELLPSLTAIDNIKLPQLVRDEMYLYELLHTLEIEKYAKYYPDQMSGGQQQRVAIARALINHPPILLADEPTGNLDSKTERIVIDLLKMLIRKYMTSIVLVTHNENLVQDVDRMIRMEDGEIING